MRKRQILIESFLKPDSCNLHLTIHRFVVKGYPLKVLVVLLVDPNPSCSFMLISVYTLKCTSVTLTMMVSCSKLIFLTR